MKSLMAENVNKRTKEYLFKKKRARTGIEKECSELNTFSQG